VWEDAPDAIADALLAWWPVPSRRGRDAE